ncbi:hypothetical protein B4119_2724 [Parageobacillus caldoxylosilyticus]|uniref:Uncharacterized protein n=1 Tax=Saccharococcus caldoxylosilyticus TaxID=81408 RepID=A0A150LD28_9BACL|nr:hypothetical protein B4119_2724 [Parageobacillus caldoxylosilyticus]
MIRKYIVVDKSPLHPDDENHGTKGFFYLTFSTPLSLKEILQARNGRKTASPSIKNGLMGIHNLSSMLSITF